MKLKIPGIVVTLIIIPLVWTTTTTNSFFSATSVSQPGEIFTIDAAIDASQNVGKMPDIFRAGVFEAHENILSPRGMSYLRKKFYTELMPGMTTIFVPLWADSFREFKQNVKDKGILLPVVDEAKKVISGGGIPLLDFQIMPRWLSNNLVEGEYWRHPPKEYKKWKELVTYTTDYFYKNGLQNADYRIWEEVDTGFTKDLRFWNGTKEEFNRLYKNAVEGIQSVDHDARITFGNSYAYSDILDNMIHFASGNLLPLDYIVFHPFRTPPYKEHYRGVVDHIRKRLENAGLDKDTPIYAGSWNSWLEFGSPDLRNGRPDERSRERDTEYNAVNTIQTLFAQHAGGISYHSFFTRVDHDYGVYYDAGVINHEQQFYGGWGMFTRDLVIKPVFNAFRMLAILSGKQENEVSDRLQVNIDQPDLITAIASQTKDKSKIRILLSHNVNIPSYRIEQFKRSVSAKAWDRHINKLYGENFVDTYRNCLKKSRQPDDCAYLVPEDLHPYSRCVADGRSKTCQAVLPVHLREFGLIIPEILKNYMQYPKTVNIMIDNLPFQGRATVSTLRIDESHSNSCRFNKNTEREATRTECGIHGKIDDMVRQARESAAEISEQVMKKHPLLKAGEKEIRDRLFYNGSYRLSNGKSIKNHVWIDKINNEPHVSLEGSRQVKEIKIGNDLAHKETITVQPFGIVLIEISKIEH